jgi:hypothetical protein
VTPHLANAIAELIPEAHTLTAADLAEPAMPEPTATPHPESAPKASVMAALASDSLKDGLILMWSTHLKSLRLSWRGQAIEGVTAMRVTHDGLLVDTSAGSRLLRPVADAKAEVIDVGGKQLVALSPVIKGISEFLAR